MTFSLTKTNRNRAFTLLELMFVMLIIAVLTAIMVPTIAMMRKRAEWSKTPAQMKTIVRGFHDYALDHNDFFPPAYMANSGTESELEETLRTDGRWCNSTIYSQVYPDTQAVTKGSYGSGDSGGGNGADNVDNNTAEFDSDDGSHLYKTVFVVDASILAAKRRAKNPAAGGEESSSGEAGSHGVYYYDHGFCLNRSLITDAIRKDIGDPQFSSRKRSLFLNDTSTMLIIEGSEGDHNSIAGDDFEAQIESAKLRYDNKYVHAAFMDGHIEKVRNVPMLGSGGTSQQQIDAATLFWTGLTEDQYADYQNSNSNQDAESEYMKNIRNRSTN